MMPEDRRSQHGCLVTSAILTMLLSACLACVVTLWAMQTWLPRFGPRGYVTEACAALRTDGRVQAGVGWVSPEAGYSNAMPPPFFWSRDHPNMVCGYVPWIPSLSQQGSVVFPP